MQDNRKHVANERIKNKKTLKKAVIANRLEVLEVLSGTLMREVELFRKDKETIERVNINLAAEVERFEINIIRGALIRSGGRQFSAAQMLGIKITTLCSKIKRYKITFNGLSN